MNKCFEKFPPLERKPDGSMYRMTLAQRKRARALILRNCCNCDDGNCLALDDGDACVCPQIISFSVCCKHFRFAILPLDQTLEAEIFQGKDTKRCSVCGQVFIPGSNRGKYCPNCQKFVIQNQTAKRMKKMRKGRDALRIRGQKSLY